MSSRNPTLSTRAKLKPPAGPGAPARPGARQPDAAHLYAARVLDSLNVDDMMRRLLAQNRESAIFALAHGGNRTEDQARQIFDTFLMPEYRARLPDLRARFEAVLVRDFTVAELRSVAEGRQDAARQSAAAKAGRLDVQFTDAARAWGQEVGRATYEKNKDALGALGLAAPSESQPPSEARPPSETKP